MAVPETRGILGLRIVWVVMAGVTSVNHLHNPAAANEAAATNVVRNVKVLIPAAATRVISDIEVFMGDDDDGRSGKAGFSTGKSKPLFVRTIILRFLQMFYFEIWLILRILIRRHEFRRIVHQQGDQLALV